MARVIGGDFKKNGTVKLIRRRGEINALTLPVGIMKKKFYVPKNIREIRQEAQIGMKTILNIAFNDGKRVVVSARGKEVEDLISLGLAAESRSARAQTEGIAPHKLPQKHENASPAGAIIMLSILAFVIPFLLFTFVESNGFTPVGITGLMAAFYLYCLWKPLAVPFGNARWKSGILVAILAVAIWVGIAEINTQAELADLKAADPTAYLAKLKSMGRDDRWLEELEKIDPERYAERIALIQQRKYEKAEVERRAAQKAAEEKAERERCSNKTAAYTYATILISKRLKNPDAADFHLSGAKRVMLECGRWRIRSTFDGTNSYGATIRTHYTAIVRRIGEDHWVLEEFETW